MATTNKYVKLYVPAGVSLNYYVPQGYTLEAAVPTTLIKKALKRGCTVEELKKDGTTIPLTEENFESDNGGKPVEKDATVVTDLEEIDIQEMEAEDKARMAAISEAYKKYFEELAASEDEGKEEEDGGEEDVEDPPPSAEPEEPVGTSTAPIITSEVVSQDTEEKASKSKYVIK